MQLSGIATLRTMLGRICPETQIRVVDLEIFFGPSPLADWPSVACTLEFAADLSRESGLAARSKALLLGERRLLAPGGEDGEPATGATIGDLAAEIAADLVCRGLSMSFEYGSESTGPTQARFWIESFHGRIATGAVRLAVLSIGAAVSGESAAAKLVGSELAAFDRMCAGRRPNSESRVLLAGAKARNIPFLPMCNYSSLWQFGWGACSERFWVSSSNADGVVGGMISRSKPYQKSFFASLGMPTPKWLLLTPDSDLVAAAKAIGFPCVVKPVDSGGGKGVFSQIRNVHGLKEAVAAASRHSDDLLLEEYQPGEDFRLMVVDGKMVMTIKRSPSTVIGDGEQTVEDLLDSLNESRCVEAKRGSYLKTVPKDDGMLAALADQGLNLGSVPAMGQVVRLRSNANHSTGGVCVDVTDQTHDQIKRYAEQLSLALGFRALGVDYITPDISKRHDEVGGAFLEVNATPGLEVLLTDGASAETIGAMMLGPKPGRIPTCILLADEEALDATGTPLRKMLSAGAGAMAAEWAHLGATPLPKTRLSAIERVQSLLRYPALKSLLIFWTIEDLCRFGLPVDAVDLAIILGSPPPDEWAGLLERRADRLVRAGKADEAADIASQWSLSTLTERNGA